MAGANVSTTPSSKRSVDFQLNLVPFIDLLSVLITFLLATSIWTQVSKIDVEHAEASGPPSAGREPEQTVKVRITRAGYSVSSAGAETREMPPLSDAASREQLVRVLEVERERQGHSGVELACEDGVPYEELVRVMDASLDAGLAAISVTGIEL